MDTSQSVGDNFSNSMATSRTIPFAEWFRAAFRTRPADKGDDESDQEQEPEEDKPKELSEEELERIVGGNGTGDSHTGDLTHNEARLGRLA